MIRRNKLVQRDVIGVMKVETTNLTSLPLCLVVVEIQTQRLRCKSVIETFIPPDVNAPIRGFCTIFKKAPGI